MFRPNKVSFRLCTVLWTTTALTALATLCTVAITVPLPKTATTTPVARRTALGWMALTTTTTITTTTTTSNAAMESEPPSAPRMPDQFNVDDFLKTGTVMNPMGVSGQAGKSKPETGVVFRDGSDVSRDSRTGDVLAEILLQGANEQRVIPVLASFVSPWPLASGSVFDVECRNINTGDGTFLAVTPPIPAGVSSIQSLPDAFIVNALIGPTGRFSSYGTPTDIKFKRIDEPKSKASAGTDGADPTAVAATDYATLELSFSTLSQSTQTEIPRRARIVVTIPRGTRQAVLLVGSSSALRWNKGVSTPTLVAITDSFKAIPAPTTALKVRAKERRGAL